MDVLKRTHDSFPSPKRPRSFSVRDCSGRNQKIPQSLPVSKSRMSLRSALEAALPGETLVLGPGHYWEDGADLIVEVDVRVIGDVTMPDRVVIELGGSMLARPFWCSCWSNSPPATSVYGSDIGSHDKKWFCRMPPHHCR
ncbi:hypothetical protein SO694_0000303 [Aureococcus anophagefferens]|uniref:DUF1565 domain-containing protein n=1 Tax=Aureococcus anophagefferens TaxID=44056 RepID=A0ABR1GCQ1_AURAN